MSMSVAFNTLNYANRMKNAGFTVEQAEAQAEAMADVMSELAENSLATKHDIAELEFKLEGKMKDLEIRITNRMGAIMAAGVAVLSALMVVLHIT